MSLQAEGCHEGDRDKHICKPVSVRAVSGWGGGLRVCFAGSLGPVQVRRSLASWRIALSDCRLKGSSRSQPCKDNAGFRVQGFEGSGFEGSGFEGFWGVGAHAGALSEVEV